jgi:long-subunit fatty acid transport protein
MSSTVGTVKLKGLIGFPDPMVSDLALDIDVDLKTIRYPHAGVAWRALPWLELGVSYRGGFALHIQQTFRIDGDVGAPGATPLVKDGFLELSSASQDLFQPAQLTAGASAQLTPRTRLDVDVGYHRWSVFENPAAHIDIDLDVGQFNNLVHIPPARDLPEPHFHDVVVPRIGVEHVRGPWSLRAGYVYDPSPAPEQIGESNFIDSDKHELSIGAGYLLDHLTSVIPLPVSFDGFVAITLLTTRDHEKVSPVDAIGDYRSAGHVLSAGVTSRWRF